MKPLASIPDRSPEYTFDRVSQTPHPVPLPAGRGEGVRPIASKCDGGEPVRRSILATVLLLSSLLFGPGLVPAVYAVKTEKVDLDTFAEFNTGEFENVSLTSDGHLELAPGMTNLATINDPIIWAALADGRGNVFVGTGNQGKVYKINAKGESSVFFAPNE